MTGGIRTSPAPTNHALRPRRVDSRRWWALVFGVVVGVGLMAVVHDGIADDGYITLALARNVAEHGCWCVTPGLPSNTATSPLWVLLLAVPMLVLPPVVALSVVTAALLGVTALLVAAVGTRCGWSWSAGPVAVALLATSPVFSASVGLETALVVTLLSALVYAAVTAQPGWAGLVCGLLVLTRPDLVVVGVAAAWVFRRQLLVLVPVAVVTAAPWWLLSLLMFGTPIPDTLVWKQAQTQGLGGHLLGDAAPLFVAHWPAATGLALALLASGAVVAGGWVLSGHSAHPVLVVLAGGGATHLAVMCLLGVPPFVWYLGPVTGAAALLLAFTVAGQARSAVTVGVVALVAGGVLFAARHSWAAQGNPFHANWATTAQYATVAALVPTGATVETTHGEVGAIAFFCGDRCRVVDPLSDRGRLTPLIERRITTSPILRVLYARFTPTAPVAAQYQTVAGDSGVPVWSGFGGASHIAVEPVR